MPENKEESTSIAKLTLGENAMEKAFEPTETKLIFPDVEIEAGSVKLMAEVVQGEDFANQFQVVLVKK